MGKSKNSEYVMIASKFDGKVRDLDVYQYKLYEQVPFVIGIAKFEPYTERIYRQVLCTHRNEKTN